MPPPQASRKRKGCGVAPESSTHPDDNVRILDEVLSQIDDHDEKIDSEYIDFGDSEAESESYEEDVAGSDDSDDVEPDGGGMLGGVTIKERKHRIVVDANGGKRYEYDGIDPIYDSDDSDAQEPANTIGNIPLSFYDSYPHIGYDINGKKVMRPAPSEALDVLLERIELPKGWTGLTDPETSKPLNLNQDELDLLRRLQMNKVPEEGYDPCPVS